MQNIAVVLGGGLNENGTLPERVLARLHALSSIIDSQQAVIFSSRYTLNRPQILDKQGFVIFEAKAMLDWALNKHPESKEKLYLELSSTDTVGSGMFVSSQIKSMGWQPEKITVITSGWHAARAERIFKWAWGLLGSSACEVVMLEVEGATSSERLKREKVSLAIFERNYGVIDCAPTAWLKLFREHGNYSFLAASTARLTDEYDY